MLSMVFRSKITQRNFTDQVLNMFHHNSFWVQYHHHKFLNPPLLLGPVGLIWAPHLDMIGSDETWAPARLIFYFPDAARIGSIEGFFRSIFDPRSIPAKCAYTRFPFTSFAVSNLHRNLSEFFFMNTNWSRTKKMNFHFGKSVSSKNVIVGENDVIVAALGVNLYDAPPTPKVD